MSEIWCPIPWSHIAVKSNGFLRICSHSQSGGNKNTLLQNDGEFLRIENINDDVMNCDTLKEVRQKFINNEWPEQCRRCKIEQEAGKRSRNQWEATMYDFDKNDARDITLVDGTITDQKIFSMDLRLGNKCNLQCVMCYPGESNKWYKIQEQITGSKEFMIDHVMYDSSGHKHFEWCDEKEYYDLLLEHAPHLQKIKFGGGEPWLVKNHMYFIEELIQRGYSDHIELEYSINMTFVPQDVLDTIENFKHVKLCCSVDGYGEVNEAIRHPTKWKVVSDNLDLLDLSPAHANVFTSTTVSILNIEHFVSWMEWLKHRNFNKINKDTYAGVVSHPVMNPKYLNLRLMTDKQNKQMFDYLRSQSTDNHMIEKLNQWEIYSRKIPMSEEEIDQGRKDLRTFFNNMSSVQNKDWKTIFPMCYQMMQEWQD